MYGDRCTIIICKCGVTIKNMEGVLYDAANLIGSQIGPQQTNAVYIKALALELQGRNMTVSEEAPIPIMFTPSSPDSMQHSRASHIVGIKYANIMIETPWRIVIESRVAEIVSDDHRANARGIAIASNAVDCFTVCFGRSGLVTVEQVQIINNEDQ